MKADVFIVTLFQAKYLAQIIVMGAQVVGRAFARALQQEFAGLMQPTSQIISSVHLHWHCLNEHMTSIHPGCCIFFIFSGGDPGSKVSSVCFIWCVFDPQPVKQLHRPGTAQASSLQQPPASLG